MTPNDELLLYVPGFDSDALLMQWWAAMHVSGDLGLAFEESLHPLGAFLNHFAPPRVLTLAADEQGIWWAGWFEPQGAAAFFGSWSREGRRQTKTAVRMLERAIELGFREFVALFGVTKQERLLDLHRRLGYTVLARVPRLWAADEDAWLLLLTPEGWAGRRARRINDEWQGERSGVEQSAREL